MITVLASVTVTPEHRQAFLDDTRALIASTRRESGCRSYDLARSVTASDAFTFIERWDSGEALAAHKETPQTQSWWSAWGPLVETVETEIVHAARVERL